MRNIGKYKQMSRNLRSRLMEDNELQYETDRNNMENPDYWISENVTLPEVFVYPNWDLQNRLRHAYPDKQLRDKIYKAIDDNYPIDVFIPEEKDRNISTYAIHDSSLRKSQYDPELPYYRLLDLHDKAGNPSIVNWRTTWLPDWFLRSTNDLFEGEQLSPIIQGHPSDKYYRANYKPLLNTIYIDYDSASKKVLTDLLSEYAHGISRKNLPSYFNTSKGPAIQFDRDTYDRVEYSTNGAEEYFTHQDGKDEDQTSVEGYLDSFIFDIPGEAYEVNTHNEYNNSILNLSTKLDLDDLRSMLESQIKRNKPSADFTKFWNEYYKVNPKSTINNGGGGEW